MIYIHIWGGVGGGRLYDRSHMISTAMETFAFLEESGGWGAFRFDRRIEFVHFRGGILELDNI